MSRRKNRNSYQSRARDLSNQLMGYTTIDKIVTSQTYEYMFADLGISMFDWKNLPESIDPRYLEITLLTQGRILFFKEEGTNEYICLPFRQGGQYSIYGIPLLRTPYSKYTQYNGETYTEENSVVIYNNMTRTSSLPMIFTMADRIAKLDRIMDVNANAQKTPLLITCEETQKLSMKNLYMKYEGDYPVIFGDKQLNPNAIKVLTTNAPYLCDKLYQYKSQLWNETLTYLGISNINITKKERLITDEVTRNQGGVVASRYSRLETRREACRKINDLFGLDVQCDFREDFQILDNVQNESIADDSLGGEIDE